MADEVDYEEDVDMNENVQVNVSNNDSNSSRTISIKTKGRGHDSRNEEDRYVGRGGVFENVPKDSGSGPLQCRFYRFILI